VCRAWFAPSVRSPEFPGKPSYESRLHRVARNDFVPYEVALRTLEPSMLKARGPGLMRASIMREVQCEQCGRSMRVSDGPEAGSTCSNQRPNTLTQDRISKRRPKPLAPHGRTIHVGQSRWFEDVCVAFRAISPVPYACSIFTDRDAAALLLGPRDTGRHSNCGGRNDKCTRACAKGELLSCAPSHSGRFTIIH
jgi:hypothetical protein